jgi:hypothetical protein
VSGEPSSIPMIMPPNMKSHSYSYPSAALLVSTINTACSGLFLSNYALFHSAVDYLLLCLIPSERINETILQNMREKQLLLSERSM